MFISICILLQIQIYFSLQKHSAVVETLLHQWENLSLLGFQEAIQIQSAVYGKYLLTVIDELHLE